MTWFLSVILAAIVIWLAYMVKKEKAAHKEMRNSHFEELAAMKEWQRKSLQSAEAHFDEQRIHLSESYQGEIERLLIENEDMRKNYRNQGEIITHEILENFKADLISKRILSPDEMIIMPNVYIPDEKGRTRQIDHVLLLPTGIYVIETKDWNGHIIIGMTTMRGHRFSFLADYLISEKKDTLIFDKPGHGTITVKTYEDPISEVQQTALILSRFLQNQEIKTWINALVFFNHDQKELHDWSENSIVKRFTDERQLQRYFMNELTSQKRIYGAFQLTTIKHLIESANQISAEEFTLSRQL